MSSAEEVLRDVEAGYQAGNREGDPDVQSMCKDAGEDVPAYLVVARHL